jgi:intracellular septation protein A
MGEATSVCVSRRCGEPFWPLWEAANDRKKAAVLILVGIGFGFLALVSYESFYILWAVSICLVLYGAYLYANESCQESN